MIFPLPMTKEGIYLNTSLCSKEPINLVDMIDHIKEKSLVLGGKIPSEIRDMFTEKKIRFIDYYTDELQIENALPTAEGAIGIALYELPVMLSGSNAMVVGYGRIGKVLALKLQLLGANVTVAARKSSDLAYAKAYGYHTMGIQNGLSCEQLHHFDVIFNTVPVCLFGREELSYMNENTLFIDLASFPYGINLEEATRRKIRVIQAQSLPGKFSPVSAGRILAETVVRILEKEEIEP